MAAANIRVFGSRVSFSVKQSRTQQVLGPHEQSLFWLLQTRQPVDLEADCRGMLDRGSLFYQTVKDKLAHLAQVWDAAIDLKDIYDKTPGVYPQDEEFMRSFLFCTTVLPDRANWGHDPSEMYQYQRGISPENALSRSILDECLLPPLSAYGVSLHPAIHAQLSQDGDVESLALTPLDLDSIVVKREPDETDADHFNDAYYSKQSETGTANERSLGTLLATNCVKLEIPLEPVHTQDEGNPTNVEKRGHSTLGNRDGQEPEAKMAKRS